MASFTTGKFAKHDDYMTPKSAWEEIKKYIPKDKVIWEAFYGDGNSGKYLQKTIPKINGNTNLTNGIFEKVDTFDCIYKK